jgi:hypothetical protein
VILVASAQGFNTGQSITIDSGSRLETAVVTSVATARRRFGRGNTTIPADTIRVSSPLRYAHVSGVQVSGSGITFDAPLKLAHNDGAQIASSIPTPGEPNQY